VTDDKLETIISNLLRGGVLLSVTIVATGGTAYLIRHHGDIALYSHFHGESSNLRTFAEIWRGTMQLKSDALIQLGLLVLIATPIARVALAAVGFYMERDRLYVAVSSIVLAILMYSILHAV
jgi:uncharacterized membrane protein